MHDRGAVILVLVQALVQGTIVMARSLRYQPYAQPMYDRIVFACIALLAAFSLSLAIFWLYGNEVQKNVFWRLLTGHVPVSILWLITLQPFLLLLSAINQMQYRSQIAEGEMSELVYGFVVAPVAEEVMYRLMVEALFKPLGYTVRQRIVISNSLFGILHFLAIRDRYRFAKGLAGKCAVIFNAGLTVVFQAAVFGIWSEVLLIVTGSIWPSIIVHSACNCIGPPRMLTTKDWYINGIGLCCFLLNVVVICELHGIPISWTMFSEAKIDF